jgi:hypothetical protein
MDKIQQYRQPVVTATGIFLGFMLEFANSWLPNSFSIYKFRDMVVALGTLLSIALLIVVLYRILKMNYPADSVERYYTKTLKLFIIGISVPFFSGVIVVVQRAIENF